MFSGFVGWRGALIVGVSHQKNMTPIDQDYSGFVTHPRFGQLPRITGLNPETEYGGDTFLHWHSPKECRIPDTAILANLTKQIPATVPVTHYFDVKRQCRDCGKSFIFFAEEQRYWYEDLGFGLDSNCIRCVPCRKKQQGIAQSRKKYEDLFHIPDRTIDQDIEIAECCLDLVEASVFHRQQLERVRMFLKRHLSEIKNNAKEKLHVLWKRLLSLEEKKHG
ncbi:zinc-ribbon domain containing protein [Lamprocystis purpurea]|uniref:zinc-ribbon domain containing protein n=1 Tax=Lamprocystis purpurea TaxID=61598 RepID=UPI0012F8FD11|nr:zinc-ribbon domain containing protein [Lamprocystis purpurea]